jgi:hypothetical protein
MCLLALKFQDASLDELIFVFFDFFMQHLNSVESRLPICVYVMPLTFMNHHSGDLSLPEHFGFTRFFAVATMKSVCAHLTLLLDNACMYVRA